MRDAGIDAIVAAAQLSVDYLTDHRSSFESTFRRYHMIPGAGPELLFRSFALATASGERTLVAHAATVSTALPRWSGGLEVYGAAGFDPAAAEAPEGAFRELARTLARGSADVTPLAALAAAIRKVVPHGGRVAVETAGLLPGELDELRALLPGIELGDGSVLLRLIRMVKTADEIERSREAAEIAEGALAAMVAAAAPGRTLAGARAGLPARRRRARRRPRARRDQPFGLGIATVSGYPVRERDVLLLDVGCLYRSCVSDTGVTLALEPLAGEAAERYDLVRDCLEAGARALAPGAPVSAVYRAMRDVVDGTLAERSAPQGHGLGLEPRELPFIGPPTELRLADDIVDLAVDQALEPGMVINLEVPLEVPGHYAVHVERTFLITPAWRRADHDAGSQRRSRAEDGGIAGLRCGNARVQLLDDLDRAADVPAHLLSGCHSVAAPDRLQDDAVLLDRELGCAGDVIGALTRRLQQVGQRIEHPDVDLVVARERDPAVEGEVAAVDGQACRAVVLVLAVGLGHHLDLRCVGVRRRGFGDLDLDQHAEPVEVAHRLILEQRRHGARVEEIVAAHSDDRRSPSGPDVENADCNELLDRLADHVAPDAESLHEALLGRQLVADPDLARADALEQHLGDRVAQIPAAHDRHQARLRCAGTAMRRSCDSLRG